MAVQKSKKTRSRRNMRRSHDSLSTQDISLASYDVETGIMHRRHHISKDGYYRGRKVCKSVD